MNSCPGLPHDVVVREVGLRDGLQSIAYTLPTAQKIQWLEQAFAAGVREIEVGAFVPVRYLPQLGDTAELVASARQIAGLRVSVLIPNLRGAQAAIDSGADSMILPLSASREHSLANLRKTPDDVILELKKSVHCGMLQAPLFGLRSAFPPPLAARSRALLSQQRCCA